MAELKGVAQEDRQVPPSPQGWPLSPLPPPQAAAKSAIDIAARRAFISIRLSRMGPPPEVAELGWIGQGARRHACGSGRSRIFQAMRVAIAITLSCGFTPRLVGSTLPSAT